MPFTLPPLPYPSDALEPHIDKATMEIHHGKHHNAYVTNLNKALEQAPDLAGKKIEELLKNNLAIVPDAIKNAVRNNGGGHMNHSMFWTIIGPKAGGAPVGHTGGSHHVDVWLVRQVQGTVRQPPPRAASAPAGPGW